MSLRQSVYAQPLYSTFVPQYSQPLDMHIPNPSQQLVLQQSPEHYDLPDNFMQLSENATHAPPTQHKRLSQMKLIAPNPNKNKQTTRSSTRVSYRKVRKTTVNGKKRNLYKKVTHKRAKRRSSPSVTYTPFKTTKKGVTLYIRHKKKKTNKQNSHNFGYSYDPYTSYPMSFGYYYY